LDCLSIFLGGLAIVRIEDVRAEKRTEYFPTTNPKLYSYVNLPGLILI
jgi:hypothetical protein